MTHPLNPEASPPEPGDQAVVAAVEAAGRSRLPRCGDHVYHLPSDEEWLVAWAEGNDLAPAGWPNSIARVSDCRITHLCTDYAHERAVNEWRRAGPDGTDSRRARVLRLYGKTSDRAPDPHLARAIRIQRYLASQGIAISDAIALAAARASEEA